MLAQSKLIASLELKNLFGLNVLRHTKDKSIKNRAILLGIAWAIVILMVVFYVGGLAYGLVYLGMGSILPAYLTMISSIIILVFSMFKAGSVIFSRSSYDILSSLPLKQESIVIGRFARMYAEDLLMALLVLLPGGAVYAFLVRPAWYIYPMWLVAALLLPLLPLSIATLLGVVITGISSRTKNKTVTEVILSVGIVLVVLWGSSALGMSSENLTPEMLANMAEMVAEMIGNLYPPAIWLGSAMYTGSLGALLLCAAVYFAAFAAVVLLAARNFHAVCRRLNVTNAKHDYRMEKLESSSVLKSLWLREIKRYFSSGIYVTNTIMGPILGTVAAAAYAVAGAEGVSALMGMEMNIDKWLPFVVAGSFAMMPATATSLSMEGKSWWIAKTLPLTAKQIMDGKLLMNLSLMLPFFVVSEGLMIFATRPAPADLVWLIVIPAAIIVFSCVFALQMNLLLPKFDWDSEVYVVKQSAAAAAGGFGGLIATILFALAAGLLPGSYSHAVNLICTLVLLGATALLYRNLTTADLKKL